MRASTHQSAKKNKFNLSVIRKKYIPPYDSIWRITNSNLFRKKA